MPNLSRRKLLSGALAATVVAPFVSRPVVAQSAAYPARAYSKAVIDLVNESLIIDMLHPIQIAGAPAPMTDRMAAEYRSSGITAIHHALGIANPDARDKVLNYYTLWGHYVAVNSHIFTGVDTMADILRAKRDRKVAVIMGMQNSDHFQTVDDVKLFFGLGQRVSQLTYNSQNLLGSGATDRVDGGLSDFGAAIIAAMNAIGMLVDVSHCGDRTTLDAIANSPKPIAITHSNCRALNDHPRLKTDEAIKACAAKGGMMGIAGVRNFVSAKEPTTLSDYVDHIDHVAKLVGVEHVGIGSDFDLHGYDDTPAELKAALKAVTGPKYQWREKIDTDGFDHPRRYYDLTEELLRRKYSRGDIQAILGGNFQRLLTATWGD